MSSAPRLPVVRDRTRLRIMEQFPSTLIVKLANSVPRNSESKTRQVVLSTLCSSSLRRDALCDNRFL